MNPGRNQDMATFCDGKHEKYLPQSLATAHSFVTLQPLHLIKILSYKTNIQQSMDVHP